LSRTYLNSGQPKPCKKDSGRRMVGLTRESLYESTCVVCGNKSHAHKGPSSLCIDCLLDLKAGIRRRV
jgi:hypothetical protein